jgi:hypothetical protein
VGPTMRVLGGWVREFAAGVDAGHAIRLGLPVPGPAIGGGVADDAVERHGYVASTTPAGAAARPAPASQPRGCDPASSLQTVAATADTSRWRRSPASRAGA